MIRPNISFTGSLPRTAAYCRALGRTGLLAGLLVGALVTGCSGSSSGSRSVAPPPPPAPPPATTGLFVDQRIDVGSVSRKFDVYVPEDALTTSAPVVFVLHGGTNNSATMREPDSAFREWLNIADDDGVLVIYPNGASANGDPTAISAIWNDCRTGDAVASPLDDVRFVDTLIDWAIDEYDADPSRIYVTGPSNGGLMSLRLALELGDRIAAFAAHIANNAANSECAPLNIPIPAFLLMGTDDAFIPFEGGPIKGGIFGSDLSDVVSAEQTRDFWIAYNGASAPQGTTDFENTDRNDGTTVTAEAYAGVADVVYYVVDGGGHVPPSVEHRITVLAELVVGRQNHDIEGMREAWSFLRTKRRN